MGRKRVCREECELYLTYLRPRAKSVTEREEKEKKDMSKGNPSTQTRGISE